MELKKFCEHIEKEVVPWLNKNKKSNISKDMLALCNLLKTGKLSFEYKKQFKEPNVFIRYLTKNLNNIKKETPLGKDLNIGIKLFKIKKENVVEKENVMKNNLNENYNGCTHIWRTGNLSIPVKLVPEMNYMNTPDRIDVLDPVSGQRYIANISELTPITSLTPSIIVVDKIKGFGKKEKKDVKESIDSYLEEKKTPHFLENIKEGGFRKWLGKSEDEPITIKDIERGLASKDPHVVKMANLARNMRKWKKTGPKNK